MKKLVVAIAVGMVCLGAMAQGRVTLANAGRLVYFQDSMTAVTAAEATTLGLVADLYVGTAGDNLVFANITSTGWQAANPGVFNNVTAALPAGYAGGTTPLFFQVQIRPSSFASAALAAAGGGIFGYSEIFQARASTSAISANNLTFTGTPTFSTWGPGETAILGSVGGAMGDIALIVPEPSSFALAGLGAAALLIFRRRN